MPSDTESLTLCYNRGCGQKYDPANNNEESCQHHPGAPFFHDAYKGWSCCNKKCTDFTEFLNIKGCTMSLHSNEKPPEAVKQELDESLLEQTEKCSIQPIVPSTLRRPAFDTPMIVMKPDIAAALLNEIVQVCKTQVVDDSGVISAGTTCKHSGCNATYGDEGDGTECQYHPGCPIFHEGLKYWSCCQKRTSDFNAFLSQVGCERGTHQWTADAAQQQHMAKCRWDWHQTPTHVIVSVYAKQYAPQRSRIQLSAVRLALTLIFPQQNDAEFNLDLELCGMVDVATSQLAMLPTKVEIKLRKAEPGAWTKLHVPKPMQEAATTEKPVDATPQPDDVDLSDL